MEKLDITSNSLLKILNCDNNFLEEIDLSHNANTVVLYCSNNLLTSIDISMLTKLKEFSIGDNLPVGRMPDFSHNPKLVSIHICGIGGAIYMDEAFFHQWPEVKAFNICGYLKGSVDLSLNTKMEDRWMADMPNIRILDLSASPNLRYVYLERCPKLEKLYLHKDVNIDGLKLDMAETHATIEYK